MRKFREEIAVHHRLYHPNIVLMMGVCVAGSQLMIVQELMYRDLERVLYDESIKVEKRVFVGEEQRFSMSFA